MKAFVTGATGFIGRRLVSRLVAEGADVLALVRTDQHNLPQAVRTIRGDLLRHEALGDIGRGYDRLYHLAALITFDPNRRHELMLVNGKGTASVLAAARRWGIDRSVVVSSACTIGLSHTSKEILDESHTLDVESIRRNPYLASKCEAERVALEAAEDQDVVIVNPTTVYGPGDYTLNSGTLILEVARAVILPVPPGGTNVIDVDDLIDGILAAGERGRRGSRYILGGENLLFTEIFALIADVVHHRPRFSPLPPIARWPVSLAAWLGGKISGNRFLTRQIVEDMFMFKFYSNKRAQTELDWKPMTPFRDSVRAAWDFYRAAGLLTGRV